MLHLVGVRKVKQGKRRTEATNDCVFLYENGMLHITYGQEYSYTKHFDHKRADFVSDVMIRIQGSFMYYINVKLALTQFTLPVSDIKYDE
jgi:hypothetical protein